MHKLPRSGDSQLRLGIVAEMDASELLGAVERRIDDTVRDRDRLAEAVALLDTEIERLRSDAEVVSATDVLVRSTTRRRGDLPEVADDVMGTTVSWPSARDRSAS